MWHGGSCFGSVPELLSLLAGYGSMRASSDPNVAAHPGEIHRIDGKDGRMSWRREHFTWPPSPTSSCPIRFFYGPTNQLQDFHPGSGTSRSAQSNCTKFYLSLCWGCHFIQLSGGYRRIHLSLQPFLLVLNASGILTTKQA